MMETGDRRTKTLFNNNQKNMVRKFEDLDVWKLSYELSVLKLLMKKLIFS